MVMVAFCFFACNKGLVVQSGKNDVMLEVEQLLVEPTLKFRLEKAKIHVYVGEYTSGGREMRLNYKEVYSGKVGEAEMDKIKERLKNLLHLKDEYIKPALGGIEWSVYFECNGKEKSIGVVNTEVFEVTELLKTLNGMIPLGKPKFTVDSF